MKLMTGRSEPRTGGGKRHKQDQSDRKLFNETNRLCGHKIDRFSVKLLPGPARFRDSERVGEASNHVQRCRGLSLKVRVVMINGNDKELINKHINYITRSGVEKDGRRRPFSMKKSNYRKKI